MTNSAKLKLPYMDAAQAQKHVTLNESLRGLDVVVQLSVLDRDLTAPPVTPADGDRYLVAAAATGAWAGYDQQIVAWQDNAWAFHQPQEGWRCWVADEAVLLIYQAGAWAVFSSGGGGGASALTALTDTPAAYTGAAGQWLAVGAGETATEFTSQVPLAGVNATPDLTNRLAVASPATLLNHEGAGHQLKINKAAATDTASLLFQDGFVGHAEFGLAGDDNWHVKVSPDGTTWAEALLVDNTTALATVAGDPTAALGIATKQYVDANAGSGGGGGGAANATFNARLTAVSGTPVPVTDQLAVGTIYLTPFRGNQIGLYNGTAWAVATFAEISLSIAGLAANTNYDIFVYDNVGTITLEAVAWTDNLTRTVALTTQDGIHVKSGDATRRYAGTIRTTATAGQTEDSSGGANTIARRLIWNACNRVDRTFLVNEIAVSWAYTTSTWRRMNNNANIKCEFVTGLEEDAVNAYGVFSMQSNATPVAGVGIDWLAGSPTNVLYSFGAAGGAFGTVVIPVNNLVAPGFHDISALEKGNSGATFYGFIDGAWTCGITGKIKG